LEALIYYEYGALDRAQMIVAREVENREIYGNRRIVPWLLQAQLHLERGQIDEAAAMLAAYPDDIQADILQERSPSVFYGMRQYGEAEIALERGNFEKVLSVLDPLIQVIKEIGVALFLTDMLLLRGRALMGLERLDEAGLAFGEACKLAEGSAIRRTLWRIYDQRCQLELRRGNKQDAAHWHGLSLEVVRFIADHAGLDEIRESFLAQPDVQRIIGTHLA
jgi:tetratricopeptide (TPR) repeat protein